MPAKVRRRKQPGLSRESGSPAAHEYLDFELRAWRPNLDRIDVQVGNSPAGGMSEPVSFAMPQSEDRLLALDTDATIDDAVKVGRALSRILLPPPVFNVFQQSLRIAAGQKRTGLRLRLLLDDFLADLPWEFLYRPDMRDGSALSGFLMLDPSISLVRGAAGSDASVLPVSERQRLLCVGTFWSGGQDDWQVLPEYQHLRSAVEDLKDLVQTEFVTASDRDGIEQALADPAPLFHYTGHADTERSVGLGYVLREAPNGPRLFTCHLAPMLAAARTRLAVFMACNSADAAVVRPLMERGIPAIVAARGLIYTDAAHLFCGAMYQSLAVGLSLDEAVTYARQSVLQNKNAASKCDWGRFTVFMNTRQSVLFPRKGSRAVAVQSAHRAVRTETISRVQLLLKEIDGDQFGEVMSGLAARGVLILGRFTNRRLRILEAIKQALRKEGSHYLPVLFTFRKPEGRSLIEAVNGFASLSRFVIADITESKVIIDELRVIVPQYPTLPVVPIRSATAKVYATFSDIQARDTVVRPTVVYRDEAHLLSILEPEIIRAAEAKLSQLQKKILS